jgi:hypothetical protein
LKYPIIIVSFNLLFIACHQGENHSIEELQQSENTNQSVLSIDTLYPSTRGSLTEIQTARNSSYDSLIAKLGITSDELTEKIEKNSLSDEQFDDVVSWAMKRDTAFFERVFKLYISYRPETKQIMKQIEDIPGQLKKSGKQPTLEQVDDLRNRLNKLIDDKKLGPEVKKIFKEKIDQTLSKIKTK